MTSRSSCQDPSNSVAQAGLGVSVSLFVACGVAIGFAVYYAIKSKRLKKSLVALKSERKAKRSTSSISGLGEGEKLVPDRRTEDSSTRDKSPLRVLKRTISHPFGKSDS